MPLVSYSVGDDRARHCVAGANGSDGERGRRGKPGVAGAPGQRGPSGPKGDMGDASSFSRAGVSGRNCSCEFEVIVADSLIREISLAGA